MNNSTMWKTLIHADLVKGDQPSGADDQSDQMWYVRVLQGFAGWLAALFLLGFLGFGVAGLFEYPAAMITMGLAINASTYVFFKKNKNSDFFEQMVLAFSLTGQFMFAFGLMQLFDFRDRQWVMLVGVYQVALVFLMSNYLHRFLSTWFAVIALFWSFEYVVYSGIGSALVAGLFVWIWLNKAGWSNDQDFYQPIGYALGLALLQLNVQSQMWLFDLLHHRHAETSWLMANAPWVSALLNSLVMIYFVYKMSKEKRIQLSGTTGKLLILATVLLLFSALPIIGLSSALLVLLVGFARQKIILMVMGGLALIGFVGWYYYSMSETLLFKSLVLMVIGVVLIMAYVLLRRVYSQDDEQLNDTGLNQNVAPLSNFKKWAVIVTSLVSLVGVNHAIWSKEQLIKHGQSVYLELAPVDPRSIMQGDYMRLRFAVANQIRNAQSIAKQDDTDGYVVVDVNEQGVGEFNDISRDQPLTDGQVKMQYRTRNNRIQFATNAFFFQEGDAKLFEAAKYGEFKVAADGGMLLVAMYDDNLQLLGNNRLVE